MFAARTFDRIVPEGPGGPNNLGFRAFNAKPLARSRLIGLIVSVAATAETPVDFCIETSDNWLLPTCTAYARKRPLKVSVTNSIID